MPTDSPVPPVTIRRPRDVEGPACRMLLRGLDHERGQPEFLVAVQAAPPFIAGALSFRRLPGIFGSLRLRVVRPERRRGIGSALLLAALEDARQSAVASVYAKADSHDDAEAGAEFLTRHGFTHAMRLMTVEADVEAHVPSLRARRERLASHGKIPPNARIVSLPDAPRTQVARLYAERVVHQPELAARLEAPADSDASLASSPIVMVGEEVAGFVLWSKQGTRAVVHARVVASAYRRGWVNALVMAETGERLSANGVTRLRFEMLGTNQDTQKLARRFRADSIGAVDVYRLELGASHA